MGAATGAAGLVLVGDLTAGRSLSGVDCRGGDDGG